MPLVERLVYRAVSRVMASRPSQWHVLPHGPIEPLAAGLWRVTGFTPPGALVPREMVLYRLAGSGLLVHSAVALDAAGIAQLESLGRPEVLVVPNRMHRIDAGLYKRRYPDVRVVCPAAARSIVEEVVAVDGTAEEVLPSYGIRCHAPRGIRPLELTYELPLSAGRALLFTDILFNLDAAYLRAHVPPLKRWTLRAIGSAGFFGITRLGRWMVLEDRAAFGNWLVELADSLPDLRVICVAHGSPVRVQCAEALRSAARRLERSRR